MSDKITEKIRTAEGGSKIGAALSLQPNRLAEIPCLKTEDIDLILWSHQNILGRDLSWTEAGSETGLGRTTLMRICRGTYAAKNWSRQLNKLREWQARIMEDEASVDFVRNTQSERIFEALDYFAESGGMGMILGESGMGKTYSAKQWIREKYLGRGMVVEVPPVGGTGSVVSAIGEAVGITGKRHGVGRTVERMKHTLSDRQMLILDEAGRLVPKSKGRATPTALETVRYLSDQSGCTVVLLLTERDYKTLDTVKYQFEQVFRRMPLPPVRVPEFTLPDVQPIIEQWGAFSPTVLEKLLKLVKGPGHMTAMTETLRSARRVAEKRGEILATDADYYIAKKIFAAFNDGTSLAA